MSLKDYVGMKVKVIDRGEGVIVGPSQRYNGTWVVLIDGVNEEIHDDQVRDLNDEYLKALP